MADVLEKDHNVRILKVSFDPQVAVELSNGCQITLKMIYLPPASNGECPHFQGVESTTVCNDSP